MFRSRPRRFAAAKSFCSLNGNPALLARLAQSNSSTINSVSVSESDLRAADTDSASFSKSRISNSICVRGADFCTFCLLKDKWSMPSGQTKATLENGGWLRLVLFHERECHAAFALHYVHHGVGVLPPHVCRTVLRRARYSLQVSSPTLWARRFSEDGIRPADPQGNSGRGSKEERRECQREGHIVSCHLRSRCSVSNIARFYEYGAVH